MARKLRIYFGGATYHITNRGNRREAVFYDDEDRNRYLKILEETRAIYPFILHSYCLMSNHIHLLLETIDHHPKEIMKMINSRYAIYFNKRHELVGHLFQGRYGAEIIDTPQYFLEASRYIHLNPVEAKMVERPQDYPWSSYQAFISDSKNPHISTEKTLAYFENSQKETYKYYVESILKPTDQF
ncbi:transposase [Anaerobacillus sp. CMMVII]|uniref:transposase n=1 Tax=Anaerobacillus sp. CMMVII TaxID=2755588 RepID=UPI0021B74E5E|nr:transposase [Anaerobacillus sp. CMMVII]MCT8137699.1 transposase [Anaerobacillus sp. CMMVII]